MITEERICLCALNKLFGHIPKIGHLLLEHLGCGVNVFDASTDVLRSIVGPNAQVLSKINTKALEDAKKDLLTVERLGAELIGVNDDAYPALLKECEDAPLCLYIKSSSHTAELFKGRTAIAIVGTRDISSYGKEWCSALVKVLSMAKKKPIIVSGLAYGTDIIAHNAALENGLSSIAVMATGIERIYPFRHSLVANKLSSLDGSALLTDYPIGTIPLPFNFLRRNRIIAGLCEATIIIESKIKGGGMMTASFAYNYSRDVYALPGRIDDICSMGCNWLIGEKRAEAIIDPQSLVEKLNLGTISKRSSSKSILDVVAEHYSTSLNQGQFEQIIKVFALIAAKKEANIEYLCSETGFTYQDIVYFTSILETDNYISVDLMQNCTLKRIM